ncbi:MAG TPA: hypothetical protein VG841_00895 [Caulobacterales bacterium]|nr:hypothetical protein [Caulobacterales bacterium]
MLADVTRVAVEYYDLTGKPLGVTGEVAECRASSLLNLELVAARSAGFDAIRRRGSAEERIQIKGRYKKSNSKWGRVPRIDVTKEFDAVVLVLMSGRYEVREIWEAPRDKVMDRLARPGSKSRNERGSMDVSQFKSIAQLIWSPRVR